MPRSATDATRFTSTAPHAFGKPPSSASASIPNASSSSSAAMAAGRLRTQAPPGETPQEKVRRLKAAAQKLRASQISTADKVILHGRVWADRVHRFTALSLIGITVLCGGVTVYTVGDMVIYNRRKRSEYFTEQKAAREAALHNARAAIEAGVATEEEVGFVKLNEDHTAALEKAAQEKASKKGIFTRSREWLFSGLKKEEEGEGVGTSEARLGYEALSEEDDGLGERESDVLRAIEDKKMALQYKAKEAFTKEKERQATGGPLDRLGIAPTEQEHAPEVETKKSSGGWFSLWSKR